MKALRSPLAKQVLADPEARARLRQFVGSSLESGRALPETRVALRTDGKTVVYYQPVVVPKAA
jgi:hypothetical protein